jgi:imidazole glycerol-phosphate synthase subunit HisH
MAHIAVIDYGAGNVRSVCFALERLGVTPEVTNDAERLRTASHVIFPGVGHADAAMRELYRLGLDTIIPTLKQPVLGICLGMQLLCQHSEEGDVNGLGVFPVNVVRFQDVPKVPHMGWNTLSDLKGPLMTGLSAGDFAYYVHSYYVPGSEFTIATTDYGSRFSGALQKDNFFACQFHPEKSGETGDRILRNFLSL